MDPLEVPKGHCSLFIFGYQYFSPSISTWLEIQRKMSSNYIKCFLNGICYIFQNAKSNHLKIFTENYFFSQYKQAAFPI